MIVTSLGFGLYIRDQWRYGGSSFRDNQCWRNGRVLIWQRVDSQGHEQNHIECSKGHSLRKESKNIHC